MIQSLIVIEEQLIVIFFDEQTQKMVKTYIQNKTNTIQSIELFDMWVT